MSRDTKRLIRIARWVLILPWVATMSEGCGRIEALKGARTAQGVEPSWSASMWELFEA